jgi:Flp pilus assembly pilin Flp
MNTDLGKIIQRQDGQGLVEYTLIVLLVALVFWVAVKSTNVNTVLANSWNSISNCLSNPTGC